jgi:hypothetical protein
MEQFLSTAAEYFTQESLTGVLVLVTIYYAWQAHRSATMMQKQYESMMRPYIVVKPIRDGNTYHLQISNTGKLPAENLQLELDSTFYCLRDDDRDLTDEHLFAEGVDSFAPGSEVTYFLGRNIDIFNEDPSSSKTPTKFKVTASYSYSNEEVTESTTVDLRQFANFALLRRGVNRDIKKGREALHKIAEALS